MKIAHVFSSDLQRAVRTAEAIRDAQSLSPPHVKLELLREQDFGFYEMKQFIQRARDSSSKSGKEAHLEDHRNDPGFQDVESKESMRLRMDTFVDAHLAELLDTVGREHIVIVAHGIILSHLWRVILRRFAPGNVSVTADVQAAGRGLSLEHLGGWSNTGYLDLEITRRSKTILETDSAQVSSPLLPKSSKRSAAEFEDASAGIAILPQQPSVASSTSARAEPPATLSHLSMVVRAVNSQEHLKGLKKTRGGLGSLKHDSSQMTMDSFFKKRRVG